MGLPHGIADFERIRKQKEVVAYALIVSNWLKLWYLSLDFKLIYPTYLPRNFSLSTSSHCLLA